MTSVILFVLAAVLAAVVAWVILLGRRVSEIEVRLSGEYGPTEAILRPLVDRVRDAEDAIAATYNRSAVVHFDAFGDTSGSLSHSTALLDSKGDGVIFTTINGRQESRTYAKILTGGRCDQPLSAEETKAIRAALSSSPARSLMADD